MREEQRREEQRPVAGFDIRARIGFGSDDNIFRAPSDPYIDFADPTLPIIVPETFSGTYLPVDFRAGYAINNLPYESFFGVYRMEGRFYDGDTENNADEYFHELRFGSEYDRREADAAACTAPSRSHNTTSNTSIPIPAIRGYPAARKLPTA